MMAEQFRFQPGTTDSGNKVLSVKDAVYQAIGAGSVCWEDMTGTGVFQSERAAAIGDELVRILEEQGLVTDQTFEYPDDSQSIGEPRG